MCLYPKLIKNRKYKANKKNKGIIPEIRDVRTEIVAVGCGNCEECRKMKKREWQVRLHEEIRSNDNGKFVTLTFKEEELNLLCDKVGTTESNAVATVAVRYFLERWRKKYKKSVKHWLITELGHENTERIHLHGIIWTDEEKEIEKIWKYGTVWIGNYVNEKTINYIVKYVTKLDMDHKGYKSKILTSSGIGNNYIKRKEAERNKYNGDRTREFYKTRDGTDIGLPIYYRNKIYTEEEREQLWIMKLDKEVRYIKGVKYNVRNEEDQERFNRALEAAQQKNIRLGYGSDENEWKSKDYNVSLNMLKKQILMKEYKQKKYICENNKFKKK